MYSEKFQKIKYRQGDFTNQNERIGVAVSHIVTEKPLREIVTEFCTKDDLILAEQKKVLDLFDEFCKENCYPLFYHTSVGRAFHDVFGVTSRVVRIDGEVRKIYI